MKLSNIEPEFVSHVCDDIQELVKCAPITLEMYRSLRMNSYEQKFLHPYLSNEALVWKIEHSLSNTRSLGKFEIPRHYDQYLATDGIEELLKRFKEIMI